jgi:hypothetical protein
VTITARQLMRTLATLAIVASTVSGALYGATGMAYAEHALLHGHRAAVHTARSHTRRQFPAHMRCVACE